MTIVPGLGDGECPCAGRCGVQVSTMAVRASEVKIHRVMEGLLESPRAKPRTHWTAAAGANRS